MEDWGQLFIDDTDTVLNRIDAGIESGEYSDRLEGMIDEVEHLVEKSRVREVAKQMLQYAETEE